MSRLPRGSKYPRGPDSPARPSAFMESLFIETLAIGAGRKAAADRARVAMMIVLNILVMVL